MVDEPRMPLMLVRMFCYRRCDARAVSFTSRKDRDTQTLTILSCSVQEEAEHGHRRDPRLRMGLAGIQPGDEEAGDRHDGEPGPAPEPRPHHRH